MALIHCPECGNMVSDKATTCPQCGCPIGIPLTCPECGAPISSNTQNCDNCGCPVHKDVSTNPEGEWLAEGTNKKRPWIWALIGVLFCLVCGLGYWAYSRIIKGEAEPESKEKVSHYILVDGKYAFQGNWESGQHEAQPCKLEFEKKDGRLVNGVYSNLRYQSRIPLNGTIKDDSLHFVGDINGKQLVIDLIVASDGNSLIGEGIDYAHNGDKAKLNLSKTAVDNAGDEIDLAYEESRQRAAAEEKERQKREREAKERERIYDEVNMNQITSTSSSSSSSNKNEDLSWIQGNWRCLINVFGEMQDYRVGIAEKYISVFMDGQHYYTGPYSVSGDMITCKDIYLLIDRDRKVIMANKSTPMYRF